MTGYIARLWRGQLGLAQSCGMNGLLVVLPLAIWARIDAQRPSASLRALALVTLLPLLLVFLLGVLSAVGIWRSTTRHQMFGRQASTWAVRSAQALVVLNVIVAMSVGARLVGDVRALIAARQLPAQGYEVALRGTTAVFNGSLSAAAVAELQLLVNDKSIRRLAIADSARGDAMIVPETLLTFGGDERIYRAAGLAGMPAALLAKSQNSTAIDPPIRSLIENGFVTSIFVAETRRYVRAPQWCAKNLVACARTGRQNAYAQQTPGGD